jgi:SH3 domain-containing YSC84-like protein 1
MQPRIRWRNLSGQHLPRFYMHRLSLLISLLILVLNAGCSGHKTVTTAQGTTVTGPRADSIDRLREAGEDLTQLMGAPDSGAPASVLSAAKCVAIVPSMIKGGFVIGGRHGRGVATCRTPKGRWSAPAFFTITGGSWGAQIGVEAIDLVMLIMNDQGMQNLLSSQFKIGGEASLAVGPVGRQAEATTDWKLKAQVLTYSRARGVFAGLDLNGAVIKADDEAAQAFYGRDTSFKSLLSGSVRSPADAQPFLSVVRQSFSEAKADR